ncbi:MAG: hypothetical protein GWN79_08255, partial [Actinobacteria bacterium]|nr:hypothetical protein [Actinomycetota bacterium]NIS30944.1 hypothetical protein [Actinomycetota bacterium]NIT95388.1 hypothetical protein [Actinomycetota bacterium]NIU19075.1 hypothetical protein [Actinomycetota bacterium]NIU66124.1 hypothetical protein [Actinomycetota bacterium]
LDAAAITDVLDRLPEWVVDDADRRDFDRPARTLPPPRVGETIDVSFPAGTDGPPPDVADGPLQVLRMQPVGD